MDETDSPQTPSELLVILAAIADEGIRPRPSRRNSPDVSTRVSTTWRLLVNSSGSFTTTSR